jgi:hypothetical protein
LPHLVAEAGHGLRRDVQIQVTLHLDAPRPPRRTYPATPPP